jgi:hypothetical protein
MPLSKTVPAMLAVLACAGAAGQQAGAKSECDGKWQRWGRSSHVCELRETAVPARDSVSIDAGPNGGIRVTGTDRKDVRVQATVHAWSEREDDARATVGQIVVHTDGVIHAEGPAQNGRDGWSVSYEVFAPRDTNLKLESHNGGIAIANVRGNLDFETTNGGINLDGLAGNVHGRATNGGVDVRLIGARWEGEALDVRTTNGGVRMRVPENYSARLEASTVNGGVNIDFPVVVQGRIGRDISTTLGSGGALVRAETTNGGVRVTKY